jgi:RHS repeat-associated protein
VTSVGIDNQRTGSQTYVYDGNGNPTTYRGLSVSFDAENRMTMFFPPLSQPEINGYNGDGLRAWKHIGAGGSNSTTIYFLYDGTNLLCELNASGTVTATNTWGANGLVSRRVGTTSTFYVYDPQGSVAERLDASENVVSSDLYDAYGNKLAGNPNNDPVGYCGQWGYYTDSETGLALCTYRYYDPSNGRWVTRDPIGYAGGMNVYEYVEDDPVDWNDGIGHNRMRGPGRPPRGPGKIPGKAPVKCRAWVPCAACLVGFALPAFSMSPCGRPGSPSWSQWSDCMGKYWDLFLDECKRSRTCMVALWACDIACAGVLHGMTENRPQ